MEIMRAIWDWFISILETMEEVKEFLFTPIDFLGFSFTPLGAIGATAIIAMIVSTIVGLFKS